MESNQLSEEAKEEYKGVYLSLNLAELKRGIEAKLLTYRNKLALYTLFRDSYNSL